VTFDLMWSNPPIRIGKNDLHTLLLTYLPRLTVGGHAFMVVQKHLGADSLMSWLDENLNATESTGTSTGTSTATEERPAFAVSKFSSAKGYRIIEVEHLH
ncbi:MAG: 16S rRNA methyltransferase, partial [Alloscardovia omnicolens]|nr:16S rRNA methyltransferase [Alloscardovia omnicolens]